MKAAVVLLVVSVCCHCLAKTYDRCDLARELLKKHKVPEKQLATWVCIAEHESQYNTSAVGHVNGDGSGDHGLFQISDLFWCSPPGQGWACGVSCSELEDDDISDDWICARRIFRQHQRQSGNGFAAWAVYGPHCSSAQVSKYTEDCFNGTSEPKGKPSPIPSTTQTTTTPKPTATISSDLPEKLADKLHTNLMKQVSNKIVPQSETQDKDHQKKVNDKD